jgi:hypothetical protein
MSATTISRAPRESPNVDAVLVFDPSSAELQLRISAKRNLRVCELQGSRRVLDAFGARQPLGFSTRWFGDEADVPKEMIEDVAFTNRAEFRWGCDIGVDAGNSAQVAIPAKGLIEPAAAHGIWSVVYEYPKLFGLVREKLSFTLAIDARGSANDA